MVRNQRWFSQFCGCIWLLHSICIYSESQINLFFLSITEEHFKAPSLWWYSIACLGNVLKYSTKLLLYSLRGSDTWLKTTQRSYHLLFSHNDWLWHILLFAQKPLHRQRIVKSHILVKVTANGQGHLVKKLRWMLLLWALFCVYFCQEHMSLHWDLPPWIHFRVVGILAIAQW